MTNDKRLLEVLIAINSISNDKGLGFGEKLEHILLEIVGCMGAESGSIMLVKGRKKNALSQRKKGKQNSILVSITKPRIGSTGVIWPLPLP